MTEIIAQTLNGSAPMPLFPPDPFGGPGGPGGPGHPNPSTYTVREVLALIAPLTGCTLEDILADPGDHEYLILIDRGDSQLAVASNTECHLSTMRMAHNYAYGIAIKYHNEARRHD